MELFWMQMNEHTLDLKDKRFYLVKRSSDVRTV